MPNAAKLVFREIDQSFFVDSILQGLAAVSVRTRRGPFGHDGSIITSWPEFVKKYGGESQTYDGPTQVKRAFARGAKLRINRMGHYTSPASAATLDAVKATIDESGSDFAVMGASVDLFDITLKYHGVDYNNLTIQITAASNGVANSFNLVLTHALEPDLNELYENLTIPGKPSVIDSHYLDVVKERSQLLDVTYLDISATALVAPVRPINGTWAFSGGSDGTAPADGDYIGDPAGKTGTFAFDDYNDFDFVAALDNFNATVLTGVGTYAKNREDHRAILKLPNSMTTTTTLIAGRVALNLDTRFAYIINGGLKIKHPFLDTTIPYATAEIGDVVGAACKSSAEFGPWWSFAGQQRGVLDNVVGVVNNFTDNTKLDALAQKQINCVVNDNGIVYIKGSLSAQLASSKKSFTNVVGLIIYLKKALRPVLERYIEQPNDFRTFREIYNEVSPFLDSLVGGEKRALVEYEWKGDQFANTDADLKVNNRADLDQGKYLAKLYLKEVVSLQIFTLDIISTASGVQFEENV